MYSIEQNVMNKFSTKINTDRSNSALPFRVKTSQQSPKLQSGKYRQGNGEKMFSLLDVNLNKTARSFKMPVQYERPIEESKLCEGNKECFNKAESFSTRSEDIKFSTVVMRNPSLNQKMLTCFPPHKTNLGLPERVYKTSQSSRTAMANCNAFDIKTKMQRSDVFFLKASNGEPIEIKGNNRYKESDIFFQKDNEISKSKTGEKYLFKLNVKPYNSISQSNSQWIDKNAYPNLLGHSSIEFHILNPDIKNITKTKQKVLGEPTSGNPVNKQKSLCEFFDLNRISCANPNKEYHNAINTTSKPFHRTSNVCGAYLDLYKDYRGLTDRPFSNK
jgi:hypothetical protein